MTAWQGRALVGRRRLVSAVLAASAITALAIVLPVTGTPKGTSSTASAITTTACTSPANTSTSGSSFTANETVCRIFYDQGVVDLRNFGVTVSNTTDLRNNQVITVSWTGAHPTGGIVSAEQFSAAAQQEYPVVLMECRGIDSTDVPASEQLSPETCWTASPGERVAAPPGGTAPMWSLDSYNPPANQLPERQRPIALADGV